MWNSNDSTGLTKPSLIEVQLNEVKLFDSISPSQMAESQKRDTQLSLVYEHVASGHKPSLTEIHHIRSKACLVSTTSVRPSLFNMGCFASLYFC